MATNKIAMTSPGAADAAPGTRTILLPTSTMSVENIHAGIELRSFRPGSDLKAVDRSQRLFHAVMRSKAGRPFVMGYLPDDLFARQAMMAVARHGKTIIGVAHYHVEDGTMIVRGLGVRPDYAGRKLGSALVAMALLHGRVAFGDVASIACIIRQMPDGALNEASRESFAKLGFRLDGKIGTSYLGGTFRDRHLLDSAEQDSMGAVFISYRRMEAGVDSYVLARDFLAEWSHAILRFRRKRLGH